MRRKMMDFHEESSRCTPLTFDTMSEAMKELARHHLQSCQEKRTPQEYINESII